MKPCQRNYKRIVVKIGSSLFCTQNDTVDFAAFNHLASQIIGVLEEGSEVVVVSSGAIALGMQLLGWKERPKELFKLQAAAAVGQNEVINHYRACFKAKGYLTGQVLLTWDDFTRSRYLNAKATLDALLQYKCVPIVNENDTVATDEIKFGDNDRLSALVAKLSGADMLVILSDVEGLLDEEGKAISVVDEITPAIKALACPTSKKACVGGMITKIEAAKIAVSAGIPCVIAHGRKSGAILCALKDPQKAGTLFVPKKCLGEREHWIAFGTKPKGRIIVDDGARKALCNKKSLLSVGVLRSEGNFDSGDIVSVSDTEGREFARGKAGISRKELVRVAGVRSHKEVLHRDNMVLL